jgi:hypothetical protein
MTAPTRCDCPELQPLESVPTEPVRCGCCGSPLELTCAGACGKKHIGRALRRATTRATLPADRKPRRPHQWSKKACGKCGASFQPTGGRDFLCAGCKKDRALEALVGREMGERLGQDLAAVTYEYEKSKASDA